MTDSESMSLADVIQTLVPDSKKPIATDIGRAATCEASANLMLKKYTDGISYIVNGLRLGGVRKSTEILKADVHKLLVHILYQEMGEASKDGWWHLAHEALVNLITKVHDVKERIASFKDATTPFPIFTTHVLWRQLAKTWLDFAFMLNFKAEKIRNNLVYRCNRFDEMLSDPVSEKDISSYTRVKNLTELEAIQVEFKKCVATRGGETPTREPVISSWCDFALRMHNRMTLEQSQEFRKAIEAACVEIHKLTGAREGDELSHRVLETTFAKWL